MEPRDWWNPHLKKQAMEEKYWLAKDPELEKQEEDLRERWAKKEGNTTFHMPKEYQSFWETMEPDVRAFQDSILSKKYAMMNATFEMTVDDEALKKAFGSLSQIARVSGFDLEKPRKLITGVGWERSCDVVEVTALEDPYRKYVPGNYTLIWTDQDGDDLDPDLAKRFEEMATRGAVSEAQVKTILDEWNEATHQPGPSPLAELPWGHQSNCPYRGSHHFPCTCQPLSLFGESRLWYCDCCDEPRSALQHGLCEMCEAHQYSDPRQADLEHQAISEDA